MQIHSRKISPVCLGFFSDLILGPDFEKQYNEEQREQWRACFTLYIKKMNRPKHNENY